LKNREISGLARYPRITLAGTPIRALWEEPGWRDKEDQEKLLREKERIQEEFIQNLARAKACAPRPRRDAPCFVTTAKNGLNCSRKPWWESSSFPRRCRPKTARYP